MANAVGKVLEVARKQIGTVEVPKDSNNIKYNTWYYGRAVSGSAYPYCVVFCCWVLNQAGESKAIYVGNKVASCGVLKTWAVNNGCWITDKTKLQPGDLVMYNFSGGKNPQHIGIVEKTVGRSVVAIEGNTSAGNSGSQADGGGVYRRTRSLNYVVGAVRPKYGNASTHNGITTKPSVSITVATRELSKGCKGNDVKVLQSALNVLDGAKLTVDGDFGAATHNALVAYQRAHTACGAADGIAGAKTWNVILAP